MPHSAKSSDFAITLGEFRQNTRLQLPCPESCKGADLSQAAAHLFDNSMRREI